MRPVSVRGETETFCTTVVEGSQWHVLCLSTYACAHALPPSLPPSGGIERERKTHAHKNT